MPLLRSLVLFLWLMSPLCAEEIEPPTGWSQWRGPMLDGTSPEADLAESWPEAGPPVLWSRELGQGYSSFIAVGPHVFTQTQTLYEQAVVCLDAETGSTVWSARYGWPYEGGGLYPGPRSTPTWHRGRIYFAAPDGTIGCLNAADGASIWSVNPTKQFHGRGTDFGYSCSPLVIDDKVIVPVGGLDASVVALHQNDGSVAWKGGESSASYATPLPISLNGQRQIIALLENSLAAFDQATGQLLWEDELSQGYDEHSSAPLYREPFLVVASPFRGGAKCLRLPTQPGAKPTQVWSAAKFSNDIASSVLHEGRIYGFDLRDAQSRLNRPSRGEYRCLDFETGRILWSTDRVGHANTILADGKLILFNDRGELILARASKDQYEELARTQVFTDEICWSPAAFDRGRLYLRTQTRAVCLYLGRAPLEEQRVVQTVAAIPRSRRMFDPTLLLGGEREFPATTPEWEEFGYWYLWSLAGIGIGTTVACGAAVLGGLCRQRSLGRQSMPVVGTEAGAVDANPGLDPAPRPGGLRRYLTGLLPTASRWTPRLLFWVTIIAAGAIGSPLLNSRLSDYVFLWPLVIWSALQLTVLATVWAERQVNRRRARWVSRLAGFGFLGICLLYFHLCRTLGLSIEWGFLAGFLPAFPVAALMAVLMMRSGRFWLLVDLGGSIASFSTFFAAGMLFMKWWLRVGS